MLLGCVGDMTGPQVSEGEKASPSRAAGQEMCPWAGEQGLGGHVPPTEGTVLTLLRGSDTVPRVLYKGLPGNRQRAHSPGVPFFFSFTYFYRF